MEPIGIGILLSAHNSTSVNDFRWVAESNKDGMYSYSTSQLLSCQHILTEIDLSAAELVSATASTRSKLLCKQPRNRSLLHIYTLYHNAAPLVSGCSQISRIFAGHTRKILLLGSFGPLRFASSLVSLSLGSISPGESAGIVQ